MSANGTESSEIVSEGSIPRLWIPALALGNAFSFFFLARLFLLTHPGVLQRLVSQLCCCFSARTRQPGIPHPRRSTPAAVTAAARPAKLASSPAGADSASERTGEQTDVDLSPDPKAPSCSNRTRADLTSGSHTPTSSQGGAPDDGPSPMTAPGAAQHKELAPHPDVSVIRRASSMINLVTLQWADLGCSYRSASGTKVVLQGVWGEVRHGEMHALLGPSGAGKSTLMDMLTQRKQVGELTGQLLLNGRPAGPRALVHRSTYVPQEDNFVPVMTAGETLRFFADMRLPPRLSSKAREARAAEVLAMVGLAHCYNTVVGGQLPGGLSLRGLSGGERKRLSLAVGILAAPSILFLDEPTSGLDSFAALTVMRYLSSMAKEAGHIVVASIHQPRSAIWSMFDSVTVLSRGMMMYTGRRDDMLPWFTLQLPALLQPSSKAGCTSTSPPPTSHTGSSGGLGDAPPSSATDLMAAVLAETRSEAHRPLEEDRPAELQGTRGTQQQQQQGGGEGMGGGVGQARVDKTRSRKWEFVYSPNLHGVASDWVMDLVSVGFAKPAEYFGLTLGSLSDLRLASRAFTSHYLADRKACPTRPIPLPQLPTTIVHACDGRGRAGHVAVAVTVGEQGGTAGAAAAAASPQAVLVQHQAWGQQGGGQGQEGGVQEGGGSVEQQQEEELVDQFEQVYGHASCHPSSLPSPCSHPDLENGAISLPLPPRPLHPAQTPKPGLGSPPSGAQTSSPTPPVLDITKLNKVVDQAGRQQAAARRQAEALSGLTRQEATASLPALAPQGPHFAITRVYSSHSTPAPGSLPGHTQGGGWQEGGPVRGVERAGSPGVGRRGASCWRVRSVLPTSMLRLGLHLRALLSREVTTITRNPADVAGRMLTFAWIAVFVGLIFYNLPATPEAVQLRLNLHYSNTSFFLLMPYISMSLYTSDRQYYLADISSSLYRPIIYYIAKVCATLPANLLSPVVFSLIIYGMAGLRHSALACVRVTTILSTLSLIAVQVLHCAAILAPNQDMAFMIAIGWTAVNLLMSNFFIMYSQMAFDWLSQLRWISALGYAFGGLAREELSHATYSCSQGIAPNLVSLLPRLLPNTPLLTSPLVSATLTNPGANCELRGEALLEYFKLTRPFSATLGILIGYLLVMHVLTYLALVVVSRKERR